MAMNNSTNRMPAEREAATRHPDIDLAAGTLGRVPKTLRNGRRTVKRTWTGFVQGERCWKGRRVILPDGRVAKIKQAERGWVCVTWEDPNSIILHKHAYLHASQIRLHKLAAAVVMGNCKKGVREIKSERKADTCRINGCKPCRPGRYRGRPRKSLV